MNRLLKIAENVAYNPLTWMAGIILIGCLVISWLTGWPLWQVMLGFAAMFGIAFVIGDGFKQPSNRP